MLFLYNLLWTLLFPLVFLLFPLLSLLRGKRRGMLLQRFGLISFDPAKAGGKKVVWIQAISVGEIATALPILAELKKTGADFDYVVSVTTEAGYALAERSFPGALKIFYSPLDFYPAVARVMAKVRPSVLLVIETGFWPNQLHCAKKTGTVSILANGRISERSFRNYKILAPLAGAMFNIFDLLITRDETVSRRFRELGVDEKKILSFGDVKYDTLPAPDPEAIRTYRKLFSIAPGEKVIMAGNTHEGEEEFLLDVFDELKNRFPKILLFIAPRRMERVPPIEALLRAKGKAYEKRTALKEGGRRTADIILLDTIGELSRIYFICDIIFVGKSIFPPGGGHSLLEPVAAGKLVFHGPHVQYYEEAKELLKAEGLAVELTDRSMFVDAFNRILENETVGEEIASKAGAFLKKRMGASKKTAERVRVFL